MGNIFKTHVVATVLVLFLSDFRYFFSPLSSHIRYTASGNYQNIAKTTQCMWLIKGIDTMEVIGKVIIVQ